MCSLEIDNETKQVPDPSVRFLWSRSLLLDNRKLVAFLGREPHTPLDEALHHPRQRMRASSYGVPKEK